MRNGDSWDFCCWGFVVVIVIVVVKIEIRH